jgi:hypothetical protein
VEKIMHKTSTFKNTIPVQTNLFGWQQRWNKVDDKEHQPLTSVHVAQLKYTKPCK